MDTNDPVNADAGFDQQLEQSWENFAQRLEKFLGSLGVDQGAVLVFAPAASDLDDQRRPFIQWMAQSGGGMRTEVSSNAFLGPKCCLSTLQESVLLALGWYPPTGTPEDSTPDDDPAGSPNYFRDFPAPILPGGVTALLVRTLREVFAVPAPCFLAGYPFSFGESKGLVMDLGIAALAPPSL